MGKAECSKVSCVLERAPRKGSRSPSTNSKFVSGLELSKGWEEIASSLAGSQMGLDTDTGRSPSTSSLVSQAFLPADQQQQSPQEAGDRMNV